MSMMQLSGVEENFTAVIASKADLMVELNNIYRFNIPIKEILEQWYSVVYSETCRSGLGLYIHQNFAGAFPRIL
jgi:hypothetical protein